MDPQLPPTSFASQGLATCIHSPGAKTPPISDTINAATRSQHETLNRLILDRLPLALPPIARDPTVYALGIAAFANIYFAFEQVWQDLIDTLGQHEASKDSHEAHLRRWLATLRPPGVSRTERLRRDLQHLSHQIGIDVGAQSRSQRRMMRRTQRSLRRKPHTLVAYAWVLYMALFSGGRVIRQMLGRAGPHFWQDPRDALSSHSISSKERHWPHSGTAGFSFLFFDDGKDGNELKALFKARLAELESLLTERERQDIVEAAMGIFEDCIALVHILDDEVERRATPSRTVSFAALGAGLVVTTSFLFWIWGSHWTQYFWIR